MKRHTPIRDYIVATTDRRHELRGARWESLRRGASGTPGLAPEMERTRLRTRFEHGMAFETYEAIAHALPEPGTGAMTTAAAELSAPEKLSVLLHHSVWPLRWEPLNGSGQHRAVASPGALFPVDLHLLARTRNGPRVLHCSPRDLCLVEARALPEEALPADADALSMIVVGNLGRCVRGYGDLALCLVAIEAGMLQTQLRLVAETLGWRLRCEVDHDHDAARATLGIAHWSEMPMLRCRLSGDGAAAATEALATHRLTTIRPLPHHAASDEHPLMREVVRLADRREIGALRNVDDAETAPHAEADAHDPFPLLEATRRRSSGLGQGIVRWTEDFTAECLRNLLNDTRRLARNDALPAASDTALAVSLAWRATERGPLDLYDLDASLTRMIASPANAERLRLARGMCRDNTCLLVTIGVDARRIDDEAGARSLLDAYLGAGALSQCFSLASARRGLVARAFMAYPDAKKNPLVSLERRALVQVLIGCDTRPNPAFPMA